MALTWAAKQQIKIFVFLSVFIFIVVGLIIYRFSPAPSCKDGKLNQHEERIDCGGECEACVINPKNLVVSWARPFEVVSGRYDVAALIQNPNLNYGAVEINYTFTLYDRGGVAATRDGKTFLNPNEKFVIFENNISSKTGGATEASIKFKDIKWKKFEDRKNNILITSKDFKNSPNGFSKVTLKNQTLFPIQNIYSQVVLLDSVGNAVGISSTKLDEISGEEAREVFFTWRAPVDFVATIDAYVRTIQVK